MWNLVADVGGTNMRFAALEAGGEITARATRRTAGGASLLDACVAFAEEQGTPPAWIVVAAAGPVRDGKVSFTNARQSLSESELRERFPDAQVRILNDFAAAAWSLATVAEADVELLRGTLSDDRHPRLIIGPGTGLGVGALVRSDARLQVIAGEGGHVTLSPRSRWEFEVFEALVGELPDFRVGTGIAVEAEALLSGTGIPSTYRAVAAVEGGAAPLEDAEAIFEAAEAGSDRMAELCVALFRSRLGGLAGDLGLAFGAWGGIFITGGVAQSNRWVFDADFLRAVADGGRYTDLRRQLPLCLYNDEDFGLLGARNYIAAQTENGT
jgi:glucokinase